MDSRHGQASSEGPADTGSQAWGPEHAETPPPGPGEQACDSEARAGAAPRRKVQREAGGGASCKHVGASGQYLLQGPPCGPRPQQDCAGPRVPKAGRCTRGWADPWALPSRLPTEPFHLRVKLMLFPVNSEHVVRRLCNVAPSGSLGLYQGDDSPSASASSRGPNGSHFTDAGS